MKHLSPFLLPAHYAKTLMVVGMMLIVTKLSGNLQWSWAVVLSPFYAVHLFYALLTVCVLTWLRIDNWLQKRWAARYYERLKREQADAAYDATGLPGFLQESHDRRPNIQRIQVDLGDGRVLNYCTTESKPRLCARCDGAGVVEASSHSIYVMTCPVCQGEGK